jgi:hypothetical protein
MYKSFILAKVVPSLKIRLPIKPSHEAEKQIVRQEIVSPMPLLEPEVVNAKKIDVSVNHILSSSLQSIFRRLSNAVDLQKY